MYTYINFNILKNECHIISLTWYTYHWTEKRPTIYPSVRNKKYISWKKDKWSNTFRHSKTLRIKKHHPCSKIERINLEQRDPVRRHRSNLRWSVMQTQMELRRDTNRKKRKMVGQFLQGKSSRAFEVRSSPCDGTEVTFHSWFSRDILVKNRQSDGHDNGELIPHNIIHTKTIQLIQNFKYNHLHHDSYNWTYK